MKVSPKKSLGQHFLINPRILDKIVTAAEISKEDTILEVGPGIGNLTEKLAEKAGWVIAVEKDRRLIEELRKKFKNKNVEIIEGDVLNQSAAEKAIAFIGANYKIVGNIPYYITSNLLRTIFDPRSRTSSNSVRYGARKWPRPKLIVLTIQKEVAQRITAKPPKMNLLAVSVQFFSEPKIVSYVSKENFRPRPKVDSAIIRLKPRGKLPIDDAEKLFKLVRAGFSQKRKQLKNNLNKILGPKTIEVLIKAGINPESRAEELTVSDWLRICA